MVSSAYFDIDDSNTQTLVVTLKKSWTAETLDRFYREFDKAVKSAQTVKIDGGHLDQLDTVGGWYLMALKSDGRKVEFTGFDSRSQRVLEMVGDLNDVPPKHKTSSIFVHIPALLGRQGSAGLENVKQAITLLGSFIAAVPGMISGRQPFRLRSIVYHINDVGYKALPVICLMAFSIALVMGYQGATQLRNFGASIYTIDLVAISVLREMGVLLTAIMVAGRTGSAFAAQLGTMQLNEEVDALKTMGSSAFNILVMPRLLALLIVLPILTFISNIVGLFGMYIYSAFAMNISQAQFINRLAEVITPEHFWTGMVKSPVFALIIGIVSCMQGLQTRNSAEEVGRHTTAAVVQSIFLVILADAVFSIIFTKLDI